MEMAMRMSATKR